MTTKDITDNVVTLLSVWTFLVLVAFSASLFISVSLSLPFWGAFIVGFVIFFAVNMLRVPMTKAFVTSGM